MTHFPRAARPLAALVSFALLASPLAAQQVPATPPAIPQPTTLQRDGETPWLYENSDIPVDREWLFGKLDNGLRYAVRHNGVPPDQVSIRIRIDAGSLYEKDSEQGFAHLLEHMLFRQSRYLGFGEAIPTWQRLGATFGTDTNAETSPTQTVFKLDLPAITPAKLDESMKLLSGMVQAPVFNDKTLAADRPIVLAEMRENGGPGMRVALESRKTLFAGQRLAERLPIGTLETLEGATPAAVKAFHDRWYRPENVVISIAGDTDPELMAGLIEKYFGGWKVAGKAAPAPDFGDPVAPAGADAANPVGEVAVEVEPDLPRNFTYAILRPWRPVDDTIEYNEGLMMDQLAQALINRRLEARARGGGSYLFAQVQQDDVSRSADATFVSFAPLTEDWQAALSDVRGVIADALATPPTQEELDREISEFEVAFKASVAEREVQAGSALADTIVQAVDIRETTASPETVLSVFQGMQAKITPEAILEHTRDLFQGPVTRAVYTTPAQGEANDAAVRTALLQPAQASADARLAAKDVSFDDLPPVGAPGTVAAQTPLGILDITRVELSNGVTALLWANDAEPGRVAVKVRFGAGYRAFDAQSAPYASLGETALISSGLGDLGQEELDRLATGRKLGFDFGIEDAAFTLGAQTRQEDLADQLYLFAAKLGMPRWEDKPVIRAKAAARLAYDTYSTSPAGLIQRDLDYLLSDKDPRYEVPTPEMIAQTTPEGFEKVWAPLLKQGPVEVMIFGDFDQAAAIEALRKTFGALPARDPIPAAVAARVPGFPAPQPVTVEYHRGDANQAAAVIAWPTGGGVENLRESRQLEILTQLFNNRLMEKMREHAGASYAPVVRSDWPVDLASGGNIAAFAQLRPEDVPVFFDAANSIAQDLAANPPSADELERVTEPLRNQVTRASTGNTFWMWQLEGATTDPRRVGLVRSLLVDYSQTTPERMQALAAKYLAARPGYRAAFIPQGTQLATKLPAAPAGEAAATR